MTSDTKKIWELRRSSILADKAIIGLSLLLEGNKKHDLLEAGVKFCETIIAGLNSIDYETGENVWVNVSKAALLRDKASVEGIDEIEISPSDLRSVNEFMLKTKKTFEDMISGLETVVPEHIEELQSNIHSLSMVLYRTDINNLRSLKNKRSLKAYG